MTSPDLSGSSMSAAASRATCAVGDERTASRLVDVLSESLDGNDVAVVAFEQPGGRWDVTMYFAQEPERDAIRDLIAQAAGQAVADTLTFDAVAATDWVKSSLEGLVPVSAGRFVVHGSHDRARVQPNKLGIEIEAALAFGTGHHGTTRGCLLLLDRVLCQRTPKRVLDLGSGTGVLAIAAAKALRRPILASDIDPRSVIVARENARLNGVGNWVESICATGFASPRFTANGPFGLVLANILANPLRQLAMPMARHLAPSGYVILSGLLPHQADSVVAAYRANGIKLVRRLQVDGWASLLMQRA
ncbi:ribosomal protein L11 methyltransferase [Afipia sp. Root123D2]|uniref:50S ribosomal protein L11 methyltransferase n=1 Tax=Afipia sp. Root123D2 TaxID=1736436 RepID=UPI0006FEB5DB|nr:50S ribosomal protein L11 methyltransferase [Afipia sp. Root123D2]KQW22079.1 ribosomal protein L11 methyltransferase [Afipia sp. Root123D2]